MELDSYQRFLLTKQTDFVLEMRMKTAKNLLAYKSLQKVLCGNSEPIKNRNIDIHIRMYTRNLQEIERNLINSRNINPDYINWLHNTHDKTSKYLNDDDFTDKPALYKSTISTENICKP